MHMTGFDGPERRRAARLPLRCRVSYRTLHEGKADPKTVAAKTLNLSASGLCLVSPRKIARDTHLAMELELHGHPEAVVAVGRVVWCDAADEGFRLGVCFTWLREEDRKALAVISSYVQARLRS